MKCYLDPEHINSLAWCLFAAAVGMTIACTRKPVPPPPPPVEEHHEFGEASAEEYVRALEDRTFPGMEASPRFPVVYFDFDSDALRPEFREPLAAAVRHSRARWACYVDGHASPDGPEEYNLALGDRRAATVAVYLESIGRISTVSTSYGEERPVPGDPALSRRVEVKCQ